MNEFEEHPNEARPCAVVVSYDETCGNAAFLSLTNYKTGPIPMCRAHINKMRSKAQRRQSRYQTVELPD